LTRIEEGDLRQFLTGGKLSRLQKGFDEFTFAADGHAGKSLEPLARRGLGSGVQPVGQQLEMVRGNMPVSDSFQEMLVEGTGKLAALDLRHV
jgi:hypothetical protein